MYKMQTLGATCEAKADDVRVVIYVARVSVDEKYAYVLELERRTASAQSEQSRMTEHFRGLTFVFDNDHAFADALNSVLQQARERKGTFTEIAGNGVRQAIAYRHQRDKNRTLNATLARILRALNVLPRGKQSRHEGKPDEECRDRRE